MERKTQWVFSACANREILSSNLAIREINKKTDLNIELESVERTQRRFTALSSVIKTQSIPDGARSNS